MDAIVLQKWGKKSIAVKLINRNHIQNYCLQSLFTDYISMYCVYDKV